MDEHRQRTNNTASNINLSYSASNWQCSSATGKHNWWCKKAHFNTTDLSSISNKHYTSATANIATTTTTNISSDAGFFNTGLFSILTTSRPCSQWSPREEKQRNFWGLQSYHLFRKPDSRTFQGVSNTALMSSKDYCSITKLHEARLHKYCLNIRDGPNVRLWHSAEAEGLGRLTERVPNVRPNFGRMLCARMKQRLLLVSALSGQKMS